MMENKLYIGIDNGVSGTIGCIYNNRTWFFETPTVKEQNYTKAKGNISRINHDFLRRELMRIRRYYDPEAVMCLLERPMVNPQRFLATTSALRALESTLIILEQLEIPFQYEDSKKWQRELLPKGTKGSTALKEASKQIGKRLFPQHSELIEKHGDADGILIAEYCRRIF